MITGYAPLAGAAGGYLTVTPICTVDAPLSPTIIQTREARGGKRRPAIMAALFALNRATAAPVWNWKELCQAMEAIRGVLMEILMRK